MNVVIEHLQDIQLTHIEALALAQLVKRLNWAEIRACAVNDEEAYQIKDAIAKLQSALAYRGYAPR
ncbi:MULTISPECIES: DUF7706 family protein [Photorhabdus]|uniref:Uncharacterized protein n=2 Tax=Photorhabdus asymbiotica TaxID=291112 RepID=B6VN33_PHOAA|nr:hypothetical protein [Photorhabdus asymbiotica]CAR67563.1 Hypothetical Protein PA-RVA15-17-0994 [Photorhabdus asymbiotica subsp. asymbiotica ATCC 43949]RKS54139.1 hypothetical protein BDD30_4504 [Photorhabdus asymbiotica]RKS57653.1 hypothetical protein BDD30_2462 [Photorhabdus asymbiotica]RKS66972.1 hypothetical protein BDD30_1323 [Photorhabdus asymbiotica]CAQ83036.1 conserved hypothetical protein [Photorhabdus asymbiotica]